MNITVVGAGNIGTQFAAHCAEKGHSVTVFGSKPEKISSELTVINENGEILHKGTIKCATSDPQKAFSDASHTRRKLLLPSLNSFCRQQ